jgi:hypothetical protein
MTLILQDGKDLYLEYLDRDSNLVYTPLPQFFSEENSDGNTNYMNQYSYLCNQLKLYANLCLNRNVLACQNLCHIFPLSILQSYVALEHIGEEVRGYLVTLIRNLYIDREPYEVQKKPDLL